MNRLKDKNKKCYCQYDKEGNMVGLCLRCAKLRMEGYKKGYKTAIDKTNREWEKKLSVLLRGKRAKYLSDNLELVCGKRECPLCGYNPEKIENYIKNLLKHKE